MSKKSLVVSKSNTMARSCSTLDATEVKVVEYCLSTIYYEDKLTEETLFKVDVNTMADHFGMDRSQAYREIKRITTSILGKTIKIPKFLEPEYTVATSWFQSVVYNDKTEELHLRLSFDVVQHLTGTAIRRDFTSYLLQEIAKFRGVYTNRLYNLCKSHAYKGSFEIQLTELRGFLDIKDTEYKSWGNLKVILKRTIEEINEKSSLEVVMFEAGKSKGKVSLLEFRMKPLKLKEGLK